MRATPAAAMRLMPQNIDEWPALVFSDNPRPHPHPVVTNELRQLADVYNEKIGTISTRDTRSVREAVSRAHFENDHSAYGSATCVTGLEAHTLERCVVIRLVGPDLHRFTPPRNTSTSSAERRRTQRASE